jgi:hypothetical protein
MAAAAGSPAEPQHEPAPVDTGAEEEAAAATEQQTPPTPETGELLGRVASEISLAFQSSLEQVRSKSKLLCVQRAREAGGQPFALLAAPRPFQIPKWCTVTQIADDYYCMWR